MKTDEVEIKEKIFDRLLTLEKHIINLIIPIQGINEMFTNEAQTKNLINLLENPIKIDDRDIRVLLREFRDSMSQFQKSVYEFKEDIKQLDLSQTFSEIKYIGKRLSTIESILYKIKEEGVRKNIHLDFTVDGYEMVKKPLDYDPKDPIAEPYKGLKELLDTLSSIESKVIIHRLGLFGEKKKTYVQMSEVLGITRERCSQTFKKAITKLRNPKRKNLFEKITHIELRKLILGH